MNTQNKHTVVIISRPTLLLLLLIDLVERSQSKLTEGQYLKGKMFWHQTAFLCVNYHLFVFFLPWLL